MFRRSVQALLIMIAASSVAAAQSADPNWLDDLTDQIARAEQCEVAFFLNTHEYQLGGRWVFEARVQCVDGRQFDASRSGPEKQFSIRACEIAVC
jgi:protein gp37